MRRLAQESEGGVVRLEDKAAVYHDRADIQRTVADWCAEWIGVDCSSFSGLEFGAGTGHFTRHLALREFRDFTATDIFSILLRVPSPTGANYMSISDLQPCCLLSMHPVSPN